MGQVGSEPTILTFGRLKHILKSTIAVIGVVKYLDFRHFRNLPQLRRLPVNFIRAVTQKYSQSTEMSFQLGNRECIACVNKQIGLNLRVHARMYTASVIVCYVLYSRAYFMLYQINAV
jgi:hypothetical protein